MEVNGFPNYIIYKDGRCFSKFRNIYLTPRNRQDYLTYALYRDDGKQHNLTIHRLVALHYIPNPNNYRVVNHIDADPHNNNISNLEWCSDIYNAQSKNKLRSNIGTIVKYEGKRKTSYLGKVRIFGVYHYTKSCETSEKVQELLNELVKL